MTDIDKLNMAIMNIPCKKTLSHFATAAEAKAYGQGHRDARHAAVDAVLEHFKDVAEPSVAAGDERALFVAWAGERWEPQEIAMRHNDAYLPVSLNAAWKAWQARATLALKYDVGVVQSQTERMQSPAVSQTWTAEEIASSCVAAGLGVFECNALLNTLQAAPAVSQKDGAEGWLAIKNPDPSVWKPQDAPVDTTAPVSYPIGEDIADIGLPVCKPHAWQHTMDNTEGIRGNKPYVMLTFTKRNPFGRPGIDYSSSFPVTAEPLYTGKQVERITSPYASRIRQLERELLKLKQTNT